MPRTTSWSSSASRSTRSTRPRVHDGRIIVRRAPAGERLETLDHVDARPRPRDAPHRRPGRPDRHRRRHGRRRVRGRRRDDRRRRRVGHLRPDQHPPDGLPLRAALGCEPALREGPGDPAWPGSVRTARPASSPSGPAARSRRAPSTRTRSTRRRRASRSGPAASTGCSAPRSTATEQRALLGPGRASRPSRPSRARRIRVAAGTRAARRDGGRRRGRRRDRPDLATRSRGRGRHHRGDHPRPRLRHSCRRPCRDTPMPPYRHDPLAVRNAVRETLVGAGLTEVVTYALVAPAARSSGSRRTTTARSTANRSSEPPAGRSSSPTRCRASTRCCARASSAACSRSSRRTCGVGRDDVAIFEVGKGYGATGEPPTHEWWRLGFALTGAALPPALGPPGAAVRPRRRQGRHRAALPPARLRRCRPSRRSPTIRTSTRAGRRASTAGGSLVGRLGELHPARGRALDLRAERIVVGEFAIAGLAGGRPADAARRPRRRASRRSSATWRSSSPRDRPAADVEAAIRRHGGPLLRGVDAVRHLPRQAARRGREEPRLPADRCATTSGP